MELDDLGIAFGDAARGRVFQTDVQAASQEAALGLDPFHFGKHDVFAHQYTSFR
jgi:hypothetical protein